MKAQNLWVPCHHSLCARGPITSFGPCWDGSSYLYAVSTLNFVGSGTAVAVPPRSSRWDGTPPADISAYFFGTMLTMTSGAANASYVKILAADSTGIFLAAPLSAVPSAGDSYTAVSPDQSTANPACGIYQLNLYFQGKLG